MHRSSTARAHSLGTLFRAWPVWQTAEPQSQSNHLATWVTHLILLFVSLQITLGRCPGTQAQEPFDANPPHRPEPLAPPFPQQQPALMLPWPELPPVPLVPPGEPQCLPLPRLFVRQIVVTGNTVFSDEALA